jgi:hypothetical protein
MWCCPLQYVYAGMVVEVQMEWEKIWADKSLGVELLWFPTIGRSGALRMGTRSFVVGGGSPHLRVEMWDRLVVVEVGEVCFLVAVILVAFYGGGKGCEAAAYQGEGGGFGDWGCGWCERRR